MQHAQINARRVEEEAYRSSIALENQTMKNKYDSAVRLQKRLQKRLSKRNGNHGDTTIVLHIAQPQYKSVPGQTTKQHTTKKIQTLEAVTNLARIHQTSIEASDIRDKSEEASRKRNQKTRKQQAIARQHLKKRLTLRAKTIQMGR